MSAQRDIRVAYAELLFNLEDADLLEEFARSVRQNSYGSHDEQLAMVRTQILIRMGRG